MGRESRHTIVFLGVDFGEGEGIGKEMGISHDCVSSPFDGEKDVQYIWRASGFGVLALY